MFTADRPAVSFYVTKFPFEFLGDVRVFAVNASSPTHRAARSAPDGFSAIYLQFSHYDGDRRYSWELFGYYALAANVCGTTREINSYPIAREAEKSILAWVPWCAYRGRAMLLRPKGVAMVCHAMAGKLRRDREQRRHDRSRPSRLV
jgi:hypothetical protein